MAHAKDEIEVLGWRDHAMRKEMWAGPLAPTRDAERRGVRAAGDGEAAEVFVELKDARLTPALLQIVKESLTNASDHHRDMLRLGKPADRVRTISVALNGATGVFTVENDGRGIGVSLHEGGTKRVGHPIRIPEVAFMIFLAGANMSKPQDSVKGGTNGIGAKLINVHSRRLRVETVGPDAGQSGKLRGYVQVFENRAADRSEPALLALDSEAAGKHLATTAPHTKIQFEPAYEALGHAGPELGFPAIAADLEAWTRWQVYLLAAYVGPRVRVTFNGVLCTTTSAEALAQFVAGGLGPRGLEGAQLFAFPVKAKAGAQKDNPWQVVAAILPVSKPIKLGVVNGVFCSHGSHMTYLRKLIGAEAGARANRLAGAKRGAKPPSVTDSCRYLSLFVVAPIPGAAWDSQNKQKLQVPESLLKPYTIPRAALGRVAQALADYNAVLAETRKKPPKSRKASVKADKYLPARRAGGAQSARCTLLMAEGDSAIRLLQAGLTLGKENPGGPTFEHYGVFSLGGVPMNALRNVKPLVAPDGKRCLVRSALLTKNKVLANLVEVLGLSYARTYETEEEVATLRYGGATVATDQDLDGIGKILPLVLVFFHTFWPALIRRGFVSRYITPIVRAYPKRGGACVEFFYENEFERWADTADTADYTVDYYKGLAAHSDSEIAAMFRRFGDHVHRIELDAAADANFADFYDVDTAARKRILSTPVVFPTPEEAAARLAARAITCSDLLHQEAKAYKLDDIARKIPSYLDGFMEARRKIFAGTRVYFRNSSKKKKVFQLGGFVADRMAYHHGSDSLNGGIVSLAQRFPGANCFPPLVGLGAFGTRHAGGKDAGSARYINVRLARPYVSKMFPAVDTPLLPHVYEDGERAQPRYYVPVLPTAILESSQIPSEGWRFGCWARELDDVAALARAYAAGDELVARVGAAFEAHGGTINSLVQAGRLERRDAEALVGRFPMRTSLRGYGTHQFADSAAGEAERRAALLRVRRAKKTGAPFLASYGVYAVSRAKSRDVVRITELPMGRSTDSFKAKTLERLVRTAANPSGLVQGYIDESSKFTVDISVVFAEGGLAAARAKFAAVADPVAEFLGLHENLTSSTFLNLYTPEGSVREFSGDYRAAFFAWAPFRRDLYRERIERSVAVLGLRAELEAETIRYIDAVAGGMAPVASFADEAAASAHLGDKKFPAFDSELIARPGFVPTADLGRLAREGKASRAYLLNLREREFVRKARDAREARLLRLRGELAAAEASLAEKPFAGSATWQAEITAVLAAVAAGEGCNWWATD